jgi:DNA helicase-2/ATP-dependent DNA helicase PcrA
MSGILDDLTPKQHEAATQTGPVLGIAGAGTGNTMTPTAAVGHRIACGMPGSCILAVTFTNKAAGGDDGTHPPGRRDFINQGHLI